MAEGKQRFRTGGRDILELSSTAERDATVVPALLMGAPKEDKMITRQWAHLLRFLDLPTRRPSSKIPIMNKAAQCIISELYLLGELKVRIYSLGDMSSRSAQFERQRH